MPNRLADETSPYLLQHANNPVDWYPWGEEAFDEARRRDVPMFLSVGYSSCHWCHVMAHESFEDEEVAQILNDNFVPIKVDREERPDVDAVYMDAVTAMTGRGGWPMSVFLTPDGRPFFGGTYWPRDDRRGMPGFVRVLRSVTDAWEERRDQVHSQAGKLTDAVGGRTGRGAPDETDYTVADRAAVGALQSWDRQLGGFGQAPKFPQAMALEWLLDRHARLHGGDSAVGEGELACVTQSLEAMARGGIHDHVAGGFHRYSTDAGWLVPHFEKMLYDNALLAPVYAKAAAQTGNPRFDAVARDVLDYLLRDMRHPAGGFYSATDADVEGEEGIFFVWTHGEFTDVVASVDADPDLFATFFGVVPEGNWEEEASGEAAGTNILHEPVDRRDFCEQRGLDLAEFMEELGRVRAALHAHRDKRPHPGLDDKILTSWNALTVRALALSGMHLGLPEYVSSAADTARFLHDELVVDGHLHHVWKEGTASVPAFLEDVACLAVACLDLYAATGEVEWFQSALRWADEAWGRFRDEDGGGFFATAHDAQELYTRPKDSWDNATPSGNSVMFELAARLGGYTGEERWRDLTDELARLYQSDAERAPTGFGWYLRIVEGLLVGPREVAIVGRPGRERELLVRELWRRPVTGTVIAVADPDGDAADLVPLLTGREEVDGEPAAYVCRDFACERPVTGADELRQLLERT